MSEFKSVKLLELHYDAEEDAVFVHVSPFVQVCVQAETEKEKETAQYIRSLALVAAAMTLTGGKTTSLAIKALAEAIVSGVESTGVEVKDSRDEEEDEEEDEEL